MNRRMLMGALIAPHALKSIPPPAGAQAMPTDGRGYALLDKSDAQWKALLEPARYEILFEEATERPGSSALNQEKGEGTFICAACYLPIFASMHKYESGTGWPSFTQPIAGSLDTKKDFKLVWPRTEYHCSRCGGHQGHLFDDGPKPRGERWCNNGLALLFVGHGDPLPELRA